MHELVIFDCDGVLVNSEVISNEVLARMLTREGVADHTRRGPPRLPRTSAHGCPREISRSAWNLVAASRVNYSCEGDGHLRGRLGLELFLDDEGELGEVGVADDAAELALGFEHPGGCPAQAHLA